MSRLHLVAIALGVAALVLVAVGLWPVSFPLTAASLACSLVSEKQRRRDRRAAAAASEPAPAPVRGERVFEPFCACPQCGHEAHHVFGAAHEKIQPRADEIVELSVWNYPGVVRVHDRSTDPSVVMVVDRQCLTCRHEWEERTDTTRRSGAAADEQPE